MSENSKGIIVASVILAMALMVCAIMVTAGLKEIQKNAFAFLETQKQIIGDYIAYQKYDVKNIIGQQKQEMKRMAAFREGKLRNLIREEVKNANVEVTTHIGR